ncbi:MAG: hypothetical protein IH947_10775 [Bacteroidetes bacterium]|nr:hypothetical protein [Bacteroidota bacterium]
MTLCILAHANAAIVTSGTATLETALWDVPQVVVYKSSWLNYMVAKAVVNVKYISLVNLIASEEVVKEPLQNEVNVTNITTLLHALLSSKTKPYNLRQNLGNRIASEHTVEKIGQQF